MRRSSWFQRFLLPAFAFKALIIGGGYATGRELAEYFLPSGPRGGLLGIALVTVVWSVVAALTFAFARATGSTDYRAFFAHLLGRFGVLFEIAYFATVIVVLAVFGAAAGALGLAALGWPPIAGTLLLIALITLVATYGNEAVEGLFKYVSILLYATYAMFLLLCFARFGDRVVAGLAAPVPVGPDWAANGLAFASYNIAGAVAVLAVSRHFTGRRDAIIAGLLCGPLAMLPAALFFVCMIAFYPEIGTAVLPSDTMLQALGIPAFRLLFQVMIFAALLESGTGFVHAINERLAHAWRTRTGRHAPPRLRLLVTVAMLVASIFLAGRFGLVALIAHGYRLLAWAFIAVYVLPLLTLGAWRLWWPARAAPLPA